MLLTIIGFILIIISAYFLIMSAIAIVITGIFGNILDKVVGIEGSEKRNNSVIYFIVSFLGLLLGVFLLIID